jgi:hypothetical protein
MKQHLTIIAVLVAVAATSGCARRGGAIPGTKIANDEVNQKIIEAIEAYRIALEERDAEKLMLMASPSYWEDRGTVESTDDYGIDILRIVLQGRLQLATDVRYSMRYDRIRRVCPGEALERGCRAHVEVQIDASFTVPDARGAPFRKDMRDQNELVLEWTGEKWLFVSGM